MKIKYKYLIRHSYYPSGGEWVVVGKRAYNSWDGNKRIEIIQPKIKNNPNTSC